MSQRIDYTNQIIGTRKIIKNFCTEEDWQKSGLSKKQNASEWRLGQCLVCNTIMPVNIRVLKRNPPKRCSYCSNIGHKSKNITMTNNWTVYEDFAVLNISFKKQIISTYIDIDDYDKCKDRTWRISQKRNKYYIASGSGNHIIYLHQFLIGKAKDGFEIDHIDGNSLNNRKSNLRFLTKSDNARFVGVRIDNQIGIRGVSFSKKNRSYLVDLTYDKKRFYFKEWKTLEEAVWCRYCGEQYFNLNTLKNNPLFKYYDTLSEEQKMTINNYTISKIKEKSLV